MINLLKEYMFDNGLTQKQLADKLGCARSQIVRMYHRNAASPRMLHKIKKLLEIKEETKISYMIAVKRPKQTFSIFKEE
jgi:transcriptional regulator with XRE-family HTH domain